MNANFRFSFAAALLVAASAAFAETPCSDQCGEPAAKSRDWFELNQIALKVSYPGLPGYAEWRGKFDSASNDFELDSEMSDGKATRRGTILMVGGMVMAVRGNLVKPGLEFELLDGAAQSQQLVYRLLTAALPQGPDSLAKTEKVDYANDETGIAMATTTSHSTIAAPWHVSGTVRRLPGDTIEYDLQLTSGDGLNNVGSVYNPHLSGRLSRLAAARLDDRISLAGWKTYSMDGLQLAANDAATANDGDAPFRTIADVRRRLASDRDSGGKDEPGVDFSGFWKEQCEDEYGLRIVRSEEEGGKYLIAFCTPGGCEDPEKARHSFITGDRNYEIVSENELVQTGEQGGKQRYRRCEAKEKMESND